MTSTRALPNVITSMMHVTTFGRALVHVISCMMHVITFGRALVNVISCIMYVKKYFCVMSIFKPLQINNCIFVKQKYSFLFTLCFLRSQKRVLRVFGLMRSSRSQMFFKIGVLRNFANFRGKHLCWDLFLTKRLQHRCFL